MPKMRAKLEIQSVEKFDHGEKLTFFAVAKNGAYPADGSDEDNTYAHYSPGAKLEILIANPALFGQFKAGEKYYLDFTQADN
jgi:hypothetical protein